MAFCVQDHVDDLDSAAVYPDADGATPEIVQTHISVVALVGERVYKFKKALRLPFLDFGSRGDRERACRDELRLNRRLAPDTYLEVLPLLLEGGRLRVGAPGDADALDVVDWCVQMRRLPAERMLDRLLAEDGVGADEIAALARRIASFHAEARAAATDEVARAGAPGVLLGALRENFTGLRDLREDCPVPRALVDALEDRAQAAMGALKERLLARAERGLVVEGHGDLHARNVCMTDPPIAYDCLEFRLDLRAGDVATDLAFLAMDLRYRGHPGLARAAVDAYVEASGDGDLRTVLPDLVRYRAMVRSKVDAIGQAAPEIPDAERERLRDGARRHARLAAWTHVEERERPQLVIACGLPATGKSTAFLAIADETGWPVVRTDVVRKDLFGGGDRAARLPDSAYTAEANERVYAEVLRRAAGAPDRVVLVDANFRSAAQRAEAVAAARAAGRDAAIAHFACEDATVRERLRARAASGDSVSDADEAVYDRLIAGFESPGEDEGLALHRVDGALAPHAVLGALAASMVRMER